MQMVLLDMTDFPMGNQSIAGFEYVVHLLHSYGPSYTSYDCTEQTPVKKSVEPHRNNQL